MFILINDNLLKIFSRGNDPGTYGDPAGKGAKPAAAEACGEMLPEAV